ncbi:4a-hydroxytetrahydrobiopterin dehydratase [Microlunatus spumicola]|uniref:Putative pterin-4-alpha-carbinolamine dehydratase n=1 Tax=Microlunatus spumicola TaxID=81499 RepID=A0ABP6WHA4_9ACTN
MPRLLAPDDLKTQLTSLPAWRLEGDALVRDVQRPDFAAGLALVVAVAEEAGSLNHHPDVDLRYTSVRFALWTHVSGGVTQYDVELAHRIEALIREGR